MAPMLLRGLKGVNISCASPASTANMRINKKIMENGGQHGDQHCRARARSAFSSSITPSFMSSKPKSQKPDGRKRNTSTSEEKTTTRFTSPSSSSRFLLAEDSSISTSSYLDAMFPDFDLDPVPEMIQIDSSRFHFSEGDGRLELNSSASLSRPPGDHGGHCVRSSSTCEVTGKGSDWVRFDRNTELDDDEAEILRPSGVTATVRQQVGFGASTSSWSPAAKEEDHQEDVDVRKKDKAVMMKSCAVDDGGGPQEQSHIGFRASISSSSSSSRRVLRSASWADETAILNSSFPARSRDQVVVLRVSLHCKGCEGKVRKHLSRMQGVTSFSIDFVAKKVTVVGEVTPLGVLSSVSKVKKAELWTSPTRPSSAAA